MTTFNFRFSALILFLSLGTIVKAQIPDAISIEPVNASAWDSITLTLDASKSCPSESLFYADSVMMHSGVTIGEQEWQNIVGYDAVGANGQKPKLTLISGGFQSGIKMEPNNAAYTDTITITLDAKKSCPANELLEADSVMMHSGVTIDGNVWQKVVEYNLIGANGQKPRMSDNGDSTWSITFVPRDFYGLGDSLTATAINCVFNAGNWLDGSGKAFAEDGNCADFLIPLGGLQPLWQIKFVPANFYDIAEGTDVTAINCVFNVGNFSLGEGKDWDTENPEACIDFTVPLGNVGINENPDMVSYNLYPNPVGNQLTIDNIGGVNKIEVFNVIGEVVKSIDNLSTAGVTISTSNLTSGVYFVTFHNESGVQTTKFVKN